MSNINECPAIRFVFFREESWSKAETTSLPWDNMSNLKVFDTKTGKLWDTGMLPPGTYNAQFKDIKEAGLICVGYTVDAEGVASIAVHKLGKLGRVMGKQIVTGKILAGKTFELVTVPHRLEQSVVLGAKYFLLTRERA